MTITDWKPDPDTDAYLLSTDNGLISYYYAIQADIDNDGEGNFYYKEDKSGEITESSEKEILDILNNHPENIFHRCPCLTILPNGHLRSLIERKNSS